MKTKKVLGFSIEGFFIDKVDFSAQELSEEDAAAEVLLMLAKEALK